MVLAEPAFPHTVLCSQQSHSEKASFTKPLNILILYDAASTFTKTVQEYLVSFSKYSKHNIYYAVGVREQQGRFDLSLFDVVILNYSVRLCFPDHISSYYVEALKKFDGLKVLCIQDEYDNTAQARNWISELGLNLVFSVVPPNYVNEVYPATRFPGVDFVSTLTGFIPDTLEEHFSPIPMEERTCLLGYRGRQLPYWYGNLAREKWLIGTRMKAICEEKGLLVDIECEDRCRVYGDDWYTFLGSARATLGTESGSNVFDDYGILKQRIQKALNVNPALSYEEAFERYIKPFEGHIQMNQVSPKIFESIILRTALVLFEGSYSGVVQPDLHYIPLKKDFSNVEDVLQKLQDVDYLKALTERAYQDVIVSGKYSYQSFIQRVDTYIEERVPNPKGHQLVSIATVPEDQDSLLVTNPPLYSVLASLPLETILVHSFPKSVAPKMKVKKHIVAKTYNELGRFVRRRILLKK